MEMKYNFHQMYHLHPINHYEYIHIQKLFQLFTIRPYCFVEQMPKEHALILPDFNLSQAQNREVYHFTGFNFPNIYQICITPNGYPLLKPYI